MYHFTLPDIKMAKSKKMPTVGPVIIVVKMSLFGILHTIQPL